MVWASIMSLIALIAFFFLRGLLQNLILKGLLPPALAIWPLPILITLGTLIALSRSSQPR